jgi:hypothetical protein|tara:strand:+ start:114 stop:254 length:141 start_codon:yes stop_codon:yes gene_type:complete
MACESWPIFSSYWWFSSRGKVKVKVKVKDKDIRLGKFSPEEEIDKY